MNRIDSMFKVLRKQRKKALIAFVTFGDPTPKATEALALEFQKQGADLLELGFPFSDPVADGPVIQRASNRALKKGVTLGEFFRSVRRLRQKGLSIPIVLMGYYNPIFHFGEGRFVTEAKKSGVDGVIVPDLPIEESSTLVRFGKKKNFHVIFLVAPTSDRNRRRKIVHAARGFIYYVSVTGTTGARKQLPVEVARDVLSLKRMTRLPVCVGFGVSTPKQAHKISRAADGVIVGSTLVQKWEGTQSVQKVGRMVASLAREVHR